MLKLITIAAALLISTAAIAQDTQTTTRVPNPFKDYTQEQCAAKADMGAAWKVSEHWVRDDGKERTSRARCTFDAKSARAYIAKQLAAKR